MNPVKKLLKLFSIILLAMPTVNYAHTNFDCSGTEPFWGVNIKPSSFIFKHESDTIHLTPVNPIHSGNTLTYNTKSIPDNKLVTITIKHMNCSNGMSDQTFHYHVTYKMDNQSFEGCCETKPVKIYKK